MSNYDFVRGYQHADETIGRPRKGETVDCREVAKRLLDGAERRLEEGCNPDYQRGVIARAKGGVK